MATYVASRALRERVEEFFYLEADLLDERRYRQWLDLIDDDVRYEVPLRRNVAYGDLEELENSRAGRDVLWFDESKDTLVKRVVQLETGQHWAEEPVSRITHMITNVRITDVRGQSVDTSCRALVYRNRVDDETDILVGRRYDTLRDTDRGLLLLRRHMLLEQSVLTSKNLSFFF